MWRVTRMGAGIRALHDLSPFFEKVLVNSGDMICKRTVEGQQQNFDINPFHGNLFCAYDSLSSLWSVAAPMEFYGTLSEKNTSVKITQSYPKYLQHHRRTTPDPTSRSSAWATG